MANFIFDTEARHQHYLERYKTGEVNNLSKFIVTLENKLIVNLSKTKKVTSRKRIKDTLKLIQTDAVDLLTQYSEQLQVDLEDLSLQEAEFVGATLAKSVEREEFTVPSLAQLKVAANARPFTNKILKEELKDFPRNQARLIRNAVSMGFAEGKSNAEIIKDVIGTADLNFKDGTMQVTRNAAGRMTRTSVQHIAAIARAQAYEANSDIISKYAWVSVLDGRTSPTCQARDGNVYVVGKGPLPPAHPNCRSTTVAVFDEDINVEDGQEKLDLTKGLRPDKGDDGKGKTNVSNDYNSWLGRQSKKFQDDTLGPTKAKLFRKGGLSVDKFVDRLDQPLTLAELRATFPSSWSKAGL